MWRNRDVTVGVVVGAVLGYAALGNIAGAIIGGIIFGTFAGMIRR